MKRSASILILLLATLLSGCITIRMETRINKDGSGTKSSVLALDKSVLSMLESVAQEANAPIDDYWTSVRDGAGSIKGAKVEPYSDDQAKGIKIITPFENLVELEALSSGDALKGPDIVVVSQEGDITTLRASLNVGDLVSGFEGYADQIVEDLWSEIELEYTYAIEVEGKILDYAPHDSASVHGGRVTWNLSQAGADSIDLMVRWVPGGRSDAPAILLTVVACGGLALLIGRRIFKSTDN